MPKLVPKCFTALDATVTVSLIFFSDYSLLVYKNTTDFYVSILYLVTLLNSCISYNRFSCVESLWFSTYKVISSVSRDNFISLSCLITQARSFNTVLNESGKSGDLCLVQLFWF